MRTTPSPLLPAALAPVALALGLAGLSWAQTEQARPESAQEPNPPPIDVPAPARKEPRAAQRSPDKGGAFEGTITQVMETPLSKVGIAKAQITITVGDGRVRRDVEGRGLRRGNRDGVIVDLKKKTALVYRQTLLSKHYVELTLAGYAERIARDAPSARPWDSPFDPLFFQYDGATLVKDERAAWQSDPKCMRKELRRGDSGLEVIHCPALAVDRALLEQTDPKIPRAVTGFPVRLREGTYRRPAPDAGPAATQAEKVTHKLFEVLDKAAEALEMLVRQELRTEAVERRAVTDADFELPAGFSKVNALEPSTSSSGGGGDWDWD